MLTWISLTLNPCYDSLAAEVFPGSAAVTPVGGLVG
jgi:hypothetical protein